MKKILLFILIVFIAGCGEIDNEDLAKEAAENYMEMVKKGEERSQIYLLTSDNFHDVFSYEYIDTLNEKSEKDTLSLSYSMYENVGQEKFSTYEEFKNYNKSDYQKEHGNIEILEDNEKNLELWDGKTYKDVYTLLYNVEIANEEGQKSYKKAEITLEPGFIKPEEDDEEKDSYMISNIFLR
ncbi:hypothetical protein [Terribacillus sp. JSM ZJ617]|uniref:hypothetical protein n=1 Tax=Terribacillus sp. JSM ZJ617 TaxID=3342119 RepID=UPI0035A827F3